MIWSENQLIVKRVLQQCCFYHQYVNKVRLTVYSDLKRAFEYEYLLSVIALHTMYLNKTPTVVLFPESSHREAYLFI